MLLAVALGLFVGAAPAHAGVRDLEGRSVNPLRVPDGVQAVVLIFTSVECPVSSRYAPEMRRLQARFAPHGVRFWLVFPNPADRPDAIREHLSAFNYPAAIGVLVDPRQDLVRLTGATVTPEAVVLDRRGARIYRGRIDDRYADIGIDRQTPTTRDLEDAVTAALSGRPVSARTTRAVGCFIADFAR